MAGQIGQTSRAVHGRDWWKQPIDATRGLLEIGKKYQTREKREASKTGNACCYGDKPQTIWG